MKVENLSIERRPSYDSEYPNMLVGIVKIKGEHGSMEVKLSNNAVAQIFSVIKDDVQKIANYNAQQASEAVVDAMNEAPVLEHLA